MLNHPRINSLLSYQSYLQDFAPDFNSNSEIMHEAYRLELETERPFAVEREGELLSGCLDRMVLVYKGDQLVGADVIDFKTDFVDANSLSERTEYYRPQLNAYRQAVSQLTQLSSDKITARLVFVESGQVVIVDGGQPTTPSTARKRRSRSQTTTSSKSTIPAPKSASGSASKPKKQQTLWNE